MRTKMRSVGERVLAGVMALLLIVSILPMTAITAHAEDNAVVFVVTDSTTDLPVEGASFTIDGDEESETTDSSGKAEFARLADGVHDYTVSKVGYSDATDTVTLPLGTDEPISVSLVPLATVDVIGTVKDKDGNGIGGAAVDAAGYANHSTVTDEDGRFTLTVYAGKDYTISVSKDGYVDRSGIPLDFENGNEIELEAAPEKSDQAPLSFASDDPTSLTVGDEHTYQATGGTVTGEIKYSVDDPDVISINASTGYAKALSAGSAVITATLEGNAEYKDVSVTINVTVEAAEETGFAFQYGDGDKTITILDTGYANPAINETETVTYSSSNVEYATVDDNGVITPLKLTDETVPYVTITAIDGEGGEGKVISYKLSIVKAEQTISFNNETTEVTFGANDNEYQVLAVTDASGEQTVEYSIVSGPADFMPEGESTGKIKISGVGTIIVKASFSGNDIYKQAENTLTITVDWLVPGDAPYTLEGEAGSDGWYRGDVTIIPKDGYTLYKENPADGVFTDTVITAEGTTTVKFRVKDSEGHFSEVYTVEIKKDTGKPTVSLAADGLSGWDKLLSIITFGTWGKSTVDLTIASSDTGSGVDQVEYYVDTVNRELMSENALSLLAWQTYNGTNIQVAKEQVFYVYAKVTDRAGNVGYAWTNGIVFESLEPTVSIALKEGFKPKDVYNGNVPLTVTVKDPPVASGIKSVSYRVETDGKVTASGVLYSFDIADPKYSDLVMEKQFEFEVNAAANNSSNVVVYVTATDNAGNTKEESLTLSFSTTAPVISVEFGTGPEIIASENGIDYYDTARTATVTISGRKDTLIEPGDSVITIEQSRGNAEQGATTYQISKWVRSADGQSYTATVTFNGSAVYDSFKVRYTDKAGNGAEYNMAGKFAVDRDNPTGTVTIEQNTWNSLVSVLTFHLWKNGEVTVSVTKDDATSAVKSVEYIKAASDTIPELTNWDSFDNFVQPSSNEQLTVYIRLTDLVGHTTIISSDGYIVDNTPGTISLTAGAANEAGYYKDDVTVNISVTDEEPYSGIRKIEYWVTSTNDGVNTVETQRGTLYSFEYTGTSDYKGNLKIVDWATGSEEITVEKNISLTHNYLKASWNGSITVDADSNNSDDVRVYVQVTDNAGNVKTYSDSEEYGYLPLKINTTLPEIKLTYGPAGDDTSLAEPNVVQETDGVMRGYFQQNLTAYVKYTGRSSTFDQASAINGMTITRNGEELSYEEKSAMIQWEEAAGKTPNEATHTACITYSEDGNYTFAVSYTDKAGNTNSTVDISDSTCYAPYFFTVDKTVPSAANVTVQRTADVTGTTWQELVEKLTFGLFTRDKVTISAEGADETSPVTLEYYISNEAEALTKTRLDELYAQGEESGENVWKEYTQAFNSEKDNEKMVVYLRVTDYAGNYIYASSDGYVIDSTPSIIDVTVPSGNGTHNGVPVFNRDVTINFSVSDLKTDENGADAYSGIKSVKYWIVNYGTAEAFAAISGEYTGTVENTQVPEPGERDKLTVAPTTLYTFEYEGELTYDKLVHGRDLSINVIGRENNSCYVRVFIQAEDNAGNVYTQTVPLDFDMDSPSISVSFDNNDARNGIYYKETRTATISYSDSRNGHLGGLTVTTTGSNNGGIVVFSTDGEHSLSASVNDIAGNTASLSVENFVIDLTPPTGTVTANGLGTWDSLIEILTFGLWSRDAVTVTGKFDDATSPIESVSYYKTAAAKAMSVKELDALSEAEWTAFEPFKVWPDEQFSVYVRIIDYAGNVTYISTDGIIVDSKAPVEESISPEITIDPPQPVNGIYNSDVKVAISVKDPTWGETYSGLREITYRVLNQGEVTQEGVLYSFDATAPARAELLENWSGEITVESASNNSNDVVIEVTAVDNAGNTSTDSVAIKIDTTAPRIDVSFNNNMADSGLYYRDVRIATIRVTERNFDPEAVVLTLSNAYGEVPELSEWTETPGSGNGDDTVHTATISFAADGDYTFDVTCADLASNSSGAANFAQGTTNPNAFVVDRTAPVISVSFDNNDVRNGSYFNAARTATITVTERNFDVNRVDIAITAALNRAPVAIPGVTWINNGDIHIATVRFEADGDYTFSITASDMAGNGANGVAYGDAAAPTAFTIDTTPPILSISGILDESANNSAGNIGFVFTATDINFDILEPSLEAVVMKDGTFKTEKLTIGKTEEIENGIRCIIENLETDGVYYVFCKAVDKAGNEFTEVILDKPNGTTAAVSRSGDDALISFSVNRNGSTFLLDENTLGLVGRYYVQRVLEDVVITEINVDPLKSYDVILNGKTLTENTDYTVKEEDGNGKWMKYTYRIDKSLFDEEGEYYLVISSKDKAENNAFSDVKDASISFVVDRTAPVVAVTGLANDGRYQVEKQAVTLLVTDDGGALGTLIVRLLNNKGEVLSELINLSGEELLKALEQGSGTIEFLIDKGLFQNIQIICTDLAMEDSVANTYDEVFSNVSVSTSSVAIFWANKPLRYGVFGGLCAVALIGICVLVFLKKRKN